MRKSILILGLVLFLIGIIFELFSGATLPGNITIPLIYGSNQILWLVIGLIGFIIGVVGLILKQK
jgi:hypothetical protein